MRKCLHHITLLNHINLFLVIRRKNSVFLCYKWSPIVWNNVYNVILSYFSLTGDVHQKKKKIKEAGNSGSVCAAAFQCSQTRRILKLVGAQTCETVNLKSIRLLLTQLCFSLNFDCYGVQVSWALVRFSQCWWMGLCLRLITSIDWVTLLSEKLNEDRFGSDAKLLAYI